jgi:DNA polymerase-3 subunit beta
MMQFSIALPELQNVLQQVIQAIPPKSTLPVLENFYFQLSGQELTICSTDQELTITSIINVSGESDGTVLVPARKLSEIIKALGKGMITLTQTEQNHVMLKTDHGEYTMFGMDAEDFPDIPQFDSTTQFQVSQNDVQDIANRTIFAASKDEFRPAMTGVYLQFSGEGIEAVTTDGFRLVRLNVPTTEGINTDSPFQVIIPARAMELLKKITADVNISFTDTHAVFTYGNTEIITRLIDEKYPTYQNVIPNENDKELRFRTADALSAVKRVSLFANNDSRQIHFDMNSNSWTIVGEDTDSGNRANEEVECSYEGEELKIGFNYKYVEDALSHLGAEEAVMLFSGDTRPALIKSVQDGEVNETVLMLVMPVRL